ncbi:hypothetical protein LEP1GSC115_4367 [Leptospira interrogans serovar Australis str. 200703203]|uniref:Uncharacterized protein n=1 Tax=Leptospira interrogans serovar Australis str. 200703203 TaxID=1085541 RepID=N1UFA5_LEPIR|nr:hypothetical protein LEP1GSC115_4367 [Leptospira interrogans serovar Australis str. 200703203]
MNRVGKLNTTLSYGSRWKTQHKALYESRWKTQHNAFLWVALENSAQRFPMGRVGKLSTTLSYGSRCGVGTKFYRRFCRNSDIDLEIQLFVGLVMIKNSIEFEKFRRIGAESAVQPTTGFCSNFLR